MSWIVGHITLVLLYFLFEVSLLLSIFEKLIIFLVTSKKVIVEITPNLRVSLCLNQK